MTESDVALLTVASSATVAKIISALLSAENIPHWIDGRNLNDEYAAAQRLSGVASTRIEVPTSALPRAREIMEEARACGEELARQEWSADGED